MAKSITEIDKNFIVEGPSGDEKAFYDVRDAPMEVSGLGWFYEGEHAGKFCRLPAGCMKGISEGVDWLSWHTSGAMVRFRTDASRVEIDAELSSGDDMSHMPRTGCNGFDLFVGTGIGKRYSSTTMPAHGQTEIRAAFGRDLGTDMKDCTVYLPLYNGVKKMRIALSPDAKVDAPTPFAVTKPVAFYGSSITQGGCASRTGNSYSAMICRWLDAPLLNFGFSGSACGEAEMARQIASLDLSVLVMDYDHNAPTAEHLQKTHEPFFKIVREAHPDLPVVFASACDYDTMPERFYKNRDIIHDTYENARKSGDKNVYFVDGATLFGHHEREACTVDGCHPNDLGFYRMACGMLPAIKQGLSNG